MQSFTEGPQQFYRNKKLQNNMAEDAEEGRNTTGIQKLHGCKKELFSLENCKFQNSNPKQKYWHTALLFAPRNYKW